MRVVWEAIGGAVLPVLREADQVTDLALLRRLAHRARQHGWSARDLAALSDDEWEYARTIIQAEDVTDLFLADMVDLILAWELSEAQYGLTTAASAALDVTIEPE